DEADHIVEPLKEVFQARATVRLAPVHVGMGGQTDYAAALGEADHDLVGDGAGSSHHRVNAGVGDDARVRAEFDGLERGLAAGVAEVYHQPQLVGLPDNASPEVREAGVVRPHASLGNEVALVVGQLEHSEPELPEQMQVRQV